MSVSAASFGENRYFKYRAWVVRAAEGPYRPNTSFGAILLVGIKRVADNEILRERRENGNGGLWDAKSL